ncbi:RDD family protein [Chthonobacter albigriseus]|uniref:RDD family protein n=1 Tax=Chthonobacter albigriseus TaxID=1683161 RepID=UPI0015EE4F10|nr:RDD family protein [Chthonobacter albigriseus]
MTHVPSTFPADPLTDGRLYDGVRTRRAIGFLLDAVVLAILTLLASVLIFFLGIFTLGLGWLLYPLLWPVLALIYCAFTMGGPNSATPGMRAMGLEVRQLDGQKLTPVIAAIHSVLFYASVSILTPFVLVVALISDRKRLLHDLVLGTVVVNRR